MPDLDLVFQAAVVLIDVEIADIGRGCTGHLIERNLLGAVRAGGHRGLRAVVMLCVAVLAQDRTGIGVDLVVVFGIAAAGLVDKLDLILHAAVVVVQLALNNDHFARTAACIAERNVARLIRSEVYAAARRTGAAGREIGVKVGHFTGQEHRAVRRIPLDVLAHDLADRTQRQVNRAFVQHRVNLAAVDIAEGTRSAVDDDGIIRTHLNSDVLRSGGGVRRAVRRAGGAVAADGSGVGRAVPVDVFTHQLTDRADRDISCTIVTNRVYFLPLRIVERAFHAVNTDGRVRAELCRNGIRHVRGPRGAAQQGGKRHCAD